MQLELTHIVSPFSKEERTGWGACGRNISHLRLEEILPNNSILGTKARLARCSIVVEKTEKFRDLLWLEDKSMGAFFGPISLI